MPVLCKLIRWRRSFTIRLTSQQASLGIYCHRRRVGYFKGLASLGKFCTIALPPITIAYFIGAAGVVVLNIEAIPQVIKVFIMPFALRQQPVALSGQPS